MLASNAMESTSLFGGGVPELKSAYIGQNSAIPLKAAEAYNQTGAVMLVSFEIEHYCK